ncbi:MAG TPA: DUF374 domain-containing protein [Ghiorsea sp.]|nr:DUF374 domain-containing protein [Ghiorsea sp.]HIP07925.1 DUF374 domain-containing protein [Mariprofundaceae bacterium]
MRLQDKLIVWMVTIVIRFLRFTVRWQYIGADIRPENSPCIISSWHARLLLTPLLLGKWEGPLIISDHRDGELISAVFAKFSLASSRGSSSTGGAKALLKVIRMAKDGYSPGITPDGPRGPVQVVKDGVAQIAIKSGLPIVPVCYANNRFWRLSSWDKFYIPQPFSKGVVVIGEPLYANADEKSTAFTQRIQQAMDENQQQADTFFKQ